MSGKPFSASCERNREPILAVLRQHFADRKNVLEIGSGTGQHAVYFAAELPHLAWQASDRLENHAGIRTWLDEAALPNTPPPLDLDVNGAWPAARFDAVFSANTLHIMGWPEVETLFARLPQVMASSFKLAIYGPFNYGGRFTSPSNAQFDLMLKSAPASLGRAEAAGVSARRVRGAHMGIRDFEAVDALARRAGLALLEDCAMPANNRCLVWARV